MNIWKIFSAYIE